MSITVKWGLLPGPRQSEAFKAQLTEKTTNTAGRLGNCAQGRRCDPKHVTPEPRRGALARGCKNRQITRNADGASGPPCRGEGGGAKAERQSLASGHNAVAAEGEGVPPQGH